MQNKTNSLRLMIWWLCCGVVWFVLGTVFFSLYAGLFLGLFSFVLGPILALSMHFFAFKLRFWKLARYRHHQKDPVTHAILKWHLSHKGPRPEFWIYPSTQVKVFMLPEPFSVSKKQYIVLSHAFLQQPVQIQEQILSTLWRKMHVLGTAGMRLRSVEILAWFSILMPLVVVVQVLDAFQSFILGKRTMSISEWSQPFLVWLKSRLTGESYRQANLYIGSSSHQLNLLLGFWDESGFDAIGTRKISISGLKPQGHEH